MYVTQNPKFLEQAEDIQVPATNTNKGRDIQVQAAANTNTLISATVELENKKSEDNQIMITFLEIIAPMMMMMMMMKSLIIMMILMQNCLAFN